MLEQNNKSAGRPTNASRIAELEAQVQALLGKLEQVTIPTPVSVQEESINLTEKIQQDDYISVMSLLPFPLILSTRRGGQGNVKRFDSFGEVKRVIYRELVDIMEAQKSFLQNGYFYIMDSRVIRQHGLDDMYENILSKEKIEEILSTASNSVVELYESANKRQQEIIVDMLVDKVKTNPDSVNLNVIDRISRLSDVDISRRAKAVQENEERLLEIESE